MDGMIFSLDQQIEEIERELELRRGVYPRMVANRKMRQSVANYHMDRLKAVLATLLRLKAGSAAAE